MNDPQDLGVAVASEKREKTKNEDMGIQFGMSPIPFRSLCSSLKRGRLVLFFRLSLVRLGPFLSLQHSPLAKVFLANFVKEKSCGTIQKSLSEKFH